MQRFRKLIFHRSVIVGYNNELDISVQFVKCGMLLPKVIFRRTLGRYMRGYD